MISSKSISFLYAWVIIGSAVSNVLYFANTFISAGIKFSKKSWFNRSCNTIISSSRKLYFTCPNDKYDCGLKINDFILLYLISSSAILP